MIADVEPVAKTEVVANGDVQFAARQREEAHRRLWERLMSQPVLNLPKYTRDELYDDALS